MLHAHNLVLHPDPETMCGTRVCTSPTNRLTIRFSLLCIKVTSKHTVPNKGTKETISQLSFTGFSFRLVLGERQHQINRVCSSPADLWTNTWAHAPTSLNALPNRQLWSAKAHLSISYLAMCVSRSLHLPLPSIAVSIWCLSLTSQSNTQVCNSTLLTGARFQKLSLSHLTSNTSTHKSTF